MSKLNLELLSENEISDFLAGVDSLGTDKDTNSESQKWEKFLKISSRLKIFFENDALNKECKSY